MGMQLGWIITKERDQIRPRQIRKDRALSLGAQYFSEYRAALKEAKSLQLAEDIRKWGLGW